MIKPVWNATLSTMWAMGNFSHLNEFCIAAQDIGFSYIELNHSVDSRMLKDVDFHKIQISSLHEPCPADITVDELKVRDWLISSDDEDNRRQGVTAIKRSIELAAALGIKTIVVHAGSTNADWPLEKRLYKAFQANQIGTPGYMELQDQVTKSRASKIIPRFDAVQKSITELLEYCRPFRIRLGIENRYHVLDIPNLEEMESLLEMGDESELGFWFDTGHAQTLDRLGFIPHEAWLTRFSNRIIGVHLHDAMGISDHRAIGNGEIDFTLIARYVPARAIKTLEIRPNTNAEELRNSLQFLADQGIVQGVL